MYRESERGAAAVEFALLVPILIMLVFGIMEFGRVYNTQATLTNAARESVRVMAISNNQTSARDAAMNAASSLNPTLVDTNFTFSAATCTPDAQMTVTISYSLSSLTGIAGPFTMKGRGVMLCNG